MMHKQNPPSRQAPFQNSAFRKINGIKLHYRQWLPTSAHPKGKVLLVHGLAGSTYTWRLTADPLSQEGYLVVAVDLPGFGYSDRARGMDHAQHHRAQLLWTLLAQLDGQHSDETPWQLVGHSMGGGTVAAMALAKPYRTQTVVFADGALLKGGAPVRFPFKFPPIAKLVEILARRVFFSKPRFRSFLTSAYGRPPIDEELDNYLTPLLLDGTAWCLLDMVRTSTTFKEGALQDISVPAVAIWGEEDTWVSLTEAEKLQHLISGLLLHPIPGAAHCPMETHSSQFNRLLIDCLHSSRSQETPMAVL